LICLRQVIHQGLITLRFRLRDIGGQQ
jgi:hypothetical protein